MQNYQNIQKILEQCGLTKKEADFYIAALSLGTASITSITKKAEVKRPTAYLVIEELLKKNLLVSVPQGKKVFYKAEHPEKFIKKIEENRRKIEEILPELASLYSINTKEPKIRFYEGKEKLFSIYEEIFKAKNINAMISVDRFFSLFTAKDDEHFFRILVRNGGMLKDMFQNTKKAREYAKSKYRFGISKVKILPKTFNFATDILVFDDKVALMS
ncbi:MAG: hypothetical protein NT079_01965, partial [Candidatus Omnitrophica bacterium]|nr:hypothetical protein [Candidatus Omnitrophota bacterium]